MIAGLNSGNYFIRLIGGSAVRTDRLLVVK